MKSRLNYKSKRTIIIVAIIIALLAIASTGIYMFTKGNDEAKAFTEGNTAIDGSQTNPLEEGNQSGNPVEEQPTTEPNIEPEQGSQNNEGGETIANPQTPNVTGTTTSTTASNVPNQEYVTERQEEITVETGSLYVGWAPQTVAALTSSIDLIKEEVEPAYTVKKVATKINGIERNEENEIKTRVKPGDVIIYTITVTNMGNTTLQNVHIVDELVKYEETIEVLAIGDKVVRNVEYIVNNDDIKENDCIINTVEVTVPGITPEEEPTTTEEIIPANKYITISGEKTWEDNANPDNTRPESITIKVLNGKETVDTITVKENEEGKWLYTSKELPKYDDNDKIIEYKAEEISVKGYKTEQDGYDFKNIINNNLTYSVRYLEKDTNKELANTKTIGNQTYGTKVISQNEIIEIKGYNYDNASKEILTIGTGTNVINIYYTKRTDLSYSVRYLEKDTNKEIAKSKTVYNQTYNDTINTKKEVIPITGYKYDSVSKETLTIGTGTNVINIYYTKRNDLSYKVNYLEKNTNKVIAPAKTVEGQTYEATVTENAIDIAGYNKVEPTIEEITIGAGKNEINFYYTKRTDLSYTVNYLDKDTQEPIANSKSIKGLKYETTVTEKAISIDGYNKVEPTTATIVIGKVDENNVENNVINFLYTKRTDLNYTVNYLDIDTKETISESKLVEKQEFKKEIISASEVKEIPGYTYQTADFERIIITTKENIINLYYEKNSYTLTINYVYENGTEAEKTYTNSLKYKEKYSVTSPVIPGYTADIETVTGTMGTKDATVTVTYTPNKDTAYKVEHYKQNESGYVLAETENLTGTTDTTVTAIPKTYTGYTENTKHAERKANGTILGNGSLVLKLYYDRNTTTAYKVEHYKQTESGYVLAETENLTGTTDITVTATPKTYAGYTENTTHVERKATGTILGDGSLVLKLYYDRNTTTAYKVEHYKQNESGYVLAETENLTGTTDTTVTAIPKTYTGYTENTKHAERKANGTILGNGSLVLKLYYDRNTTTAYKVEHYKQTESGYVLEETENLTGTTDTTVTATPKTYEGYTENTTHTNRKASGIILGNGSLVLRLYYDRTQFTITYTDGVEGKTIFENQLYTRNYGDPTPNFDGTPTRTGYNFTGWEPTVATTVTNDATYTAQWTEKPEPKLTFTKTTPNLTNNEFIYDPYDTAENANTFVYRLKLENTVEGSYPEVVTTTQTVTDTLPDEVEYVSTSNSHELTVAPNGKTLTWNVSNIGSGDSAKYVDITVKVKDTVFDEFKHQIPAGEETSIVDYEFISGDTKIYNTKTGEYDYTEKKSQYDKAPWYNKPEEPKQQGDTNGNKVNLFLRTLGSVDPGTGNGYIYAGTVNVGNTKPTGQVFISGYNDTSINNALEDTESTKQLISDFRNRKTTFANYINGGLPTEATIKDNLKTLYNDNITLNDNQMIVWYKAASVSEGLMKREYTINKANGTSLYNGYVEQSECTYHLDGIIIDKKELFNYIIDDGEKISITNTANVTANGVQIDKESDSVTTTVYYNNKGQEEDVVPANYGLLNRARKAVTAQNYEEVEAKLNENNQKTTTIVDTTKVTTTEKNAQNEITIDNSIKENTITENTTNENNSNKQENTITEVEEKNTVTENSINTESNTNTVVEEQNNVSKETGKVEEKNDIPQEDIASE